MSARDKIKTLEEMARFCQQSGDSGAKVVHAHGSFDLLHLGHVRHLEAARRMGDYLVVTVTADPFVNKGPGRPVFDQAVRAEMVAAQQCVDFVAINDASDAVVAIQAIQPALYVKGADYRDTASDVTGRIAAERAAVEAEGGRIAFTNETTLSSSNLINRHLNVFDPPVQEYLAGMRGELDPMLELIERVKGYRVLLIGDTIIDQYDYVVPMAKSPKESLIATRYQERESFAGGVLAAARHLTSFCAEVSVITAIGHDFGARQTVSDDVECHFIVRDRVPTTRKTRYVDPGTMRKLFEVYSIDDAPLLSSEQRALDHMVEEMMPQTDVVIVTDFGHGLLSRSSIDRLTQMAGGNQTPFLAVNAQTNSGNYGFNLITKYHGADYVCIDAPEARLALSDRLSPIEDIVRHLGEKTRCDKVIVTQGKDGCIAWQQGNGVPAHHHRVPAFAKNIVDTVGAGDAFLAVTAPLVAAGGSMHQIGFIGNVVGALKVEIVGHRKSIEKPDLIKALRGLLA